MFVVLLQDSSANAVEARARRLAGAVRGGGGGGGATRGAIAAALAANAPGGRARLAARGTNEQELCAALDAASARTAVRARVAMAFPGMGTERWWWGLAAAAAPVAAHDAGVERALAACRDELAACGADAARRLGVAAFQPLLFRVHVLLEALAHAAGIEADDVASFSAGEPSGARASGALAPAAAAELCELMGAQNAAMAGAGSMTVVIGVELDDLDDVADRAGDVDVGARIGVRLGALTGTREGLARAHQILRDEHCGDDIVLKETGLDVPFHSYKLFESRREEIMTAVEPLCRRGQHESSVRWHSSVCCGVAGAVTPEWFYELLAGPSRSLDVIRSLLSASDDPIVFLELNCHRLYARTFEDVAKEEFDRDNLSAVGLHLFELSQVKRGSASTATRLIDVAEAVFLAGGAVQVTKAFDLGRALQ